MNNAQNLKQSPPAADATLRLYSAINRFFFFLRKKIKLGRKNYHESPAWELLGLANSKQKRFDELRQAYGVRFENILDRGNTLENYHLLDLLDQLKTTWDWHVPEIHTLIDVGCKNFYYAKTLQLFFKPIRLIGIELDAHVLYRNFYSRTSYAKFYISTIKNADFVDGDFCDFSGNADALTFFYPFVIPEPLVRWELPLSEFKPLKIFQKAYQVLNSQGILLMVNQGAEEFDVAKNYMAQAGFDMTHSFTASETILTRLHTPMVSLWKKSVKKELNDTTS